jgi:hypothetical protein
MVNRPFSYFYNNFFCGIKRFCVIGQQFRIMLPEIRAARPGFRQKNRPIAPQSDFSPQASGTLCRVPEWSRNIFSLWLSYNNAGRLTSKSYLPIVMLARGQWTGRPRTGRRRP